MGHTPQDKHDLFLNEIFFAKVLAKPLSKSIEMRPDGFFQSHENVLK